MPKSLVKNRTIRSTYFYTKTNKQTNKPTRQKNPKGKKYLGFKIFKVKFKGKRNMATKSQLLLYQFNRCISETSDIKRFQTFPWIFTNQTTSSKHSPPTHFAFSPKWFWLSFPFSTDHLKSTFKLKIDGLLTLTLAKAHGLFVTKYYSNFIVTTIIRFFTLQWLWKEIVSKNLLLIPTTKKRQVMYLYNAHNIQNSFKNHCFFTLLRIFNHKLSQWAKIWVANPEEYM